MFEENFHKELNKAFYNYIMKSFEQYDFFFQEGLTDVALIDKFDFNSINIEKPGVLMSSYDGVGMLIYHHTQHYIMGDDFGDDINFITKVLNTHIRENLIPEVASKFAQTPVFKDFIKKIQNNIKRKDKEQSKKNELEPNL